MSEIAIHHRPAELLQRLIRFDTSNPPGGERPCIEWIQQLLEGSGCDLQIGAQDPERLGLKGRGGNSGRRLLRDGVGMDAGHEILEQRSRIPSERTLLAMLPLRRRHHRLMPHDEHAVEETASRAAPSIAPKRVTKLSKRENHARIRERRKRWLRSAF